MMEAKEQGGEWTVEGELGRGSFGSVYLLVHAQPSRPASDTKYALKIIDEHGARKGDLEEARKELRIMRGLFHPHIVHLIDAFELQQQIHLVLELCEGGDLRTHLDHVRKRKGREKRPTSGVEESLVLSWTKQLASALVYLHHKKILHRDLKPQNIFLKDRYNLKVGDLGIARQLRFTLEMAATHIGTPLYISPEIYRGTPYSYKADIWSLGCCVYEMMALQCAFQAASRYEVMWKVVSKELGPVPECYSADLRSLTVSMLLKDPESRPSASDVHSTVQSMLQQQEQPPWEKRAPKEKPLSRPSNPKSLQAWRQDMANALIKYLSRKHALHSAGLAELASRLSRGSIQGTDDRDLSLTQTQTDTDSASGRGHVSSSASYDYSSDSFTGSESETDVTVTLGSSSRTVMGASTEYGATESCDVDSTHKTQISRGASRRSAFKVRHGPSPDVKRKKTSEIRDSEQNSGRGSQQCLDSEDVLNGEIGNVSEVDASRRPIIQQGIHENIGKAMPAGLLKARPLPHPCRNPGKYEKEVDDLHTTQKIHSGSPNENPSSLIPPKSQPPDAVNEPYNPLPPADHTGAHAAYAEEVTQWARAHLFSADRMGGVVDRRENSPEEMLSNEAGDDGENVDDVQQVLSKGERARRKKRNFLRERRHKQQGIHGTAKDQAEVQAASEAQAIEKFAELEDGGVTLYTRGQCVSFKANSESLQSAEEEELVVEKPVNIRNEMAKELGETTLNAALSAASLLRNSPSLLELQLKDLLGRECYKKYAATIVECAADDKGAL